MVPGARMIVQQDQPTLVPHTSSTLVLSRKHKEHEPTQMNYNTGPSSRGKLGPCVILFIFISP